MTDKFEPTPDDVVADKHFHAHTCGCACGHQSTAIEILLVNFLTHTIMADLDTIKTDLISVREQLTKVRAENSALRVELAAANATEVARNTELLAKVAELEALIAAGGGSPEKVAAIASAVDDIKAFLAEFDADVPDAPAQPA